MPPLPYILAFTLILLTTAFLRLLYILPTTHRTRPAPRTRGTPTHLLIVLGSGGHTAEMLSLLTSLNPAHYTYRSYVVGSGDEFSARRAEEFERGIAAAKGEQERMKKEERGEKKNEDQEEEEEEEEECDITYTNNAGERKPQAPTPPTANPPPPPKNPPNYSIHLVPRARHIHQPLLTTPLSSLHCLYACLHLLHTHPIGYPDLVLTNGPATSLILILASTMIRYFSFLPSVGRAGKKKEEGVRGGEGRISSMRVIYIESWARVRRPSLSGRIIVWCGLCDRVLVQWKGLQDRGWGEYKGVLVR